MVASIKDVAKKAEVSIATVSRVLRSNATVNPDTKKKVEKAIKALNYRPNRIAQSLRLKRSHIIGLIIPDIENSFFTRLSKAIEDVAYGYGKSIFLCNTMQSPEREEHYLKMMQDENVAGIIIAPTKSSEDLLKSYRHCKLPLVFMDKKIEKLSYDSVTLNNSKTAYVLTSHLIKNGKQKIAAIFNNDSSTGKERFQGYKQALKENKIAFDKKLIQFTDAHEPDGYITTQKLFAKKNSFDALMVSNGLLAAGALRYLMEQKIKIPTEIAFASIDETPWSRILTPQITVMKQPLHEMSQKAVDLIIEKINYPKKKPEHFIYEAELITRQSSLKE